jgi:hypothetical protein
MNGLAFQRGGKGRELVTEQARHALEKGGRDGRFGHPIHYTG